MRTCVITFADYVYRDYVKYLCATLRKHGEWKGDIILLSNGIDVSSLSEFIKKGIIVKVAEPCADPYWTKTQIFHKDILEKYDRVLYMDADTVIFKNIQPLFEQEGAFLADRDASAMINGFSQEEDSKLFSDLVKIVGPDYEGFCAGFMRYDSQIIPEGILKNLEELRNLWKAINKSFDQGILNLYFFKKWVPFKDECFWGCRKEDTIACHCTRWYAPWDRTGSQSGILYPRYLECLQYFQEEM
jgi:hypothetical protein